MRIPRQQRQTMGIRSRTSINTDSSAGSAALSAVVGMVEKYQKEEAQDKYMKAKNMRLEKINDWHQKNIDRKGEDAFGITKEYQQYADKITGEIAKETGLDGDTLKAFNDFSKSKYESERFGLINREHSNKIEVRKNNYITGRKNIYEQARLNPASYAGNMRDLQEHITHGVKQGTISESEAEAVLLEEQNKMRNYTSQEWYKKDRHEFMKNAPLMGLGEGELAEWEKKYNRDNQAEKRRIKNENSELAAQLLANVSGMEAIASDKGDTSLLDQTADKLESIGYSQKAQSIRKKSKHYADSYETLKDYDGMTLYEQKQKISKYNIGDNPENADSKLKIRNTVQSIIKKREQAFNADPVGYVQNRVVGTDEVSRTRSAIQLQLREMTGRDVAYSEIEGTPFDNKIKIYADKERSFIKQSWKAASSDLERLEILNKVEAKGEFAPKAYKELGFSSVTSLYKHLGDDEDRKMFAASLDKKIKAPPGYEVRDEKDAIASNEFIDTINQVAFLSGRPELSEYSQGLQNMYKNIARTTGSTDNADKYFKENFSTINEDNIKAIVPKRYERDDLEDVLEQQKLKVFESMKSDNEIDNISIERMIEDQTVWVNTPSGFGLMNKTTGKLIDVEESFLDYDELLTAKDSIVVNNEENPMDDPMYYAGVR